MKHQALFSLKDKSKKMKCRLLQILYDPSRVKPFTVCSGFAVGFYSQTIQDKPYSGGV